MQVIMIVLDGIHIFDVPFSTCELMYTICHSDIVGSYWADSPRSMLPIYQELIAAGIKIWVFR